MRHEWFRDDDEFRTCPACGRPDCTGRIAVDFCPDWQRSMAMNNAGKYLRTEPITHGTA